MLYQYKKTLKRSNASYTPVQIITTNRIYAVGCGKPNYNEIHNREEPTKALISNDLLNFSKF